MKNDQKQLKKQYQQDARPMGVFLVRNNLTNKIFLAAGLDLKGIINRHKFALKHGGHQNKSLQAEWNELGSDNFAFEIVDELKPRTEPGVDQRAELESLENLWLEKLQPYDERGYNERKLSRGERLQRIAKKARASD